MKKAIQFEMGGAEQCFNLAVTVTQDGERLARETAARQTAQEAAEARQVKFFQDERAAGTLQGAVMGNPSAAVRVLGPMEVIRIGCGSGKGAA